MLRIRMFLMFVLASCLLPSCWMDPKRHSVDGDDPREQPIIPDGPLAEGLPPQLVGNWEGPCQNDLTHPNVAGSLSARERFIVAPDGSGMIINDLFKFNDCRADRTILETIENFRIQRAETKDKAIFVEYRMGASTLRLLKLGVEADLRAKALKDWNAQAPCGLNDWILNTPRVVTGISCGVDERFFREGETAFDAFVIQNSAMQKKSGAIAGRRYFPETFGLVNDRPFSPLTRISGGLPDPDDGDDGGTPDDPKQRELERFRAQLTGSWISPCVDGEDAFITRFRKRSKLIFRADGSAVRSTYIFISFNGDGDPCEKPDAVAEQGSEVFLIAETYYSFAIEDLATPTATLKMQGIAPTLQLKKFMGATATSGAKARALARLNAANLCGRSNWDFEEIVAGPATCLGEVLSPAFASFRIQLGPEKLEILDQLPWSAAHASAIPAHGRIVGSYQAACSDPIAINDEQTIRLQRLLYFGANGQGYERTRYYRDLADQVEQCVDDAPGAPPKNRLAELITSFSYQVAPELQVSGLPLGFFPLDMQIGDSRLTLFSLFGVNASSPADEQAEYLKKFNDEAPCGYTDWNFQTTHDVQGRSCLKTLVPTSGTRIFDIYQIARGLRLGKKTMAADGSSALLRPTTLADLMFLPLPEQP